MAEAASQSLSKAFTEAYARVWTKGHRQVQLRTFECAAACLRRDDCGAQESDRCVTACQRPWQALAQASQQEISNFQQAVGRCQQACQDKANMAGGDKAQATFDACAVDCFEEYIKALPALEERLLKHSAAAGGK